MARRSDHTPAPAFSDGRVRVERVLLGVLVRSGLTPGEVALLARDAYQGHGTAARTLGLRAGDSVSFMVTSPIGEDLRPLKGWNDQPVLSGMVEIGTGLGWRNGVLYDPRGMIPDTIVSAAVGRRISDVLTHPDIASETIVHAADERGGALRTGQEVVEVPLPRSPMPRIRTWGLRLAQRRREGNPKPSIQATYAACSAVCVLGVLINPPQFDGGLFRTALTVLGLIPLVVTTVMAIDAQVGGWVAEGLVRLTSPGATTTSHHAHARFMDEIDTAQRRRGFDNRGRAFPN